MVISRKKKPNTTVIIKFEFAVFGIWYTIRTSHRLASRTDSCDHLGVSVYELYDPVESQITTIPKSIICAKIIALSSLHSWCCLVPVCHCWAPTEVGEHVSSKWMATQHMVLWSSPTSTRNELSDKVCTYLSHISQCPAYKITGENITLLY